MPLSIEIDFYGLSDLSDDLENSPEIAPNPLSYEIDFYSSESDLLSQSSSAENALGPRTLTTVSDIPEAVGSPFCLPQQGTTNTMYHSSGEILTQLIFS
jgi:hypothetical protein